MDAVTSVSTSSAFENESRDVSLFIWNIRVYFIMYLQNITQISECGMFTHPVVGHESSSPTTFDKYTHANENTEKPDQ